MSTFITKPIPLEKPSIGRITRPWGSFSQYAFNEETTVSLMTVNPGQRLSLQSHTGRSELWIVLDDGANVQVDDVIADYDSGAEVWIPANSRHRLSCSGDSPVRVLEVAFGNWQQDDIQRYEDDYARPAEGEAS
ncbi:MAG: phosphomannose isomerase type II C-terminal cupin domain [Fimbriimonas sp.]|nr:phosphomannose isomerase type II C-terminal cupin domain [Fimbriimonas sp.]